MGSINFNAAPVIIPAPAVFYENRPRSKINSGHLLRYL